MLVCAWACTALHKYMRMSCMYLGVSVAVCMSVYILMFIVVYVDVCVCL